MKTPFFTALLMVSLMSFAKDNIPVDSIHKMNQVVVTGTRSTTSELQLSQTITLVDSATLNRDFRQNILPTLMEQVPGLMLTSRGMMGYGVSTGAAGELTIRGISSSNGRMMVLIDGHPQYNGIYGHSIADSYQTMMADRVEVLRGPASMLYGSNAMGGVINIVTKGMKHDGVRSNINLGGGSWGTFQADAMNQFRKGKISSTVSLQYGRTDNHRPNMGFQQFGGYIKLGYEISTHWNSFVDADITHFSSSNPGTVSEPKLQNDQWITRYALNLVVENNYNNLHTIAGIPMYMNGAISVYDNFGRHKINDGYIPSKGEKPKTDLFRSRDAVAGASVYQSLTIDWKNPTTFTLGVDYQHIYGRAYYTDMKTGRIVTTKMRQMQSCHSHENEFAAYFQVSQNFTRFLTLNAGLRFDHHSVAGTELVPQAGFTIRPIRTAQINLSVSKGFRNPTTKEMYLYASASDSLKAERLWNYEISWRHILLNGKLTYGLNVFYINADNIIQTVNKRNINTGHLRNAGVECEITWNIDRHWMLTTNHSYLHMENPVVSAPTYKGYLEAAWQISRWSADIGLMQVCGLYTSVGSNGSSSSKENFTLLNATVSYRPIKPLRIWVKGDNLLAQRYETVLGMPMPRATFMAGASVTF